MNKVRAFARFLLKGDILAPQVDWDAMEREFYELMLNPPMSYRNMIPARLTIPDCIPVNAREWTAVKVQHARIYELKERVKSRQMPPNLAIPGFAWKYIRGESQFKKSIQEILTDVRLTDVNEYWEKYVGDLWPVISGSIEAYIRLEKMPVFESDDFNYTIDLVKLQTSIKKFNRMNLEKVIIACKDIYKDRKRRSKYRKADDIGLKMWLGSDLDDNPKVNGRSMTFIMPVAWADAFNEAADEVTKPHLRIGLLPDVMFAYRQNVWVKSKVGHLLTDELISRYRSTATELYNWIYDVR